MSGQPAEGGEGHDSDGARRDSIDQPGPVTDPGSAPADVSAPTADERTPAVRGDGIRRSGDGGLGEGEDQGPVVELDATQLTTLIATSHWSGLLPPPEHFSAYEPWVQQHIVGWQDAASRRADEESQRANEESQRLTVESNAEVRYGDRGQKAAIILTGMSITGAFVLGVLGQWQTAAVLVGAPVAGLLVVMLPRRDSRDRRRDS